MPNMCTYYDAQTYKMFTCEALHVYLPAYLSVLM